MKRSNFFLFLQYSFNSQCCVLLSIGNCLCRLSGAQFPMKPLQNIDLNLTARKATPTNGYIREKRTLLNTVWRKGSRFCLSELLV